MLTWSKLNSIQTLLSQAPINMAINHKDFVTILKERDEHEKMKENLKNSINSTTTTKKKERKKRTSL